MKCQASMSRTADRSEPLDLLPRAEDKTLNLAERLEPTRAIFKLLAIRSLRHQQHAISIDLRDICQITSHGIQIVPRIDDELHLIFEVCHDSPNDVRPMPFALMPTMPMRVRLGIRRRAGKLR